MHDTITLYQNTCVCAYDSSKAAFVFLYNKRKRLALN